MYNRRKVALNFIMLLGTASAMQIQKTLFLYTQSLDDQSKAPYQFFPNIRGCYSLTLSNDYHALASSGFLDSSDGMYSLASGIAHDSFAVDYATECQIRETYRRYGNLPEKELAEISYELKPFYAIRSEIINTLDLTDSFYQGLVNIKRKIEAYPRTIYTIGYEGRSIDDVIRNLMCRNIKVLVDVRKNAFSMRREFSKSNLARAMDEAGIRYMHCPEVGIESEKRNELLPEGRRNELFDWYEEHTLPWQVSFAYKIGDLLASSSVAFLCYERNPQDCHRSRLAAFCSRHTTLDHGVINI